HDPLFANHSHRRPQAVMDARIKLARVPLDLGDHPARLAPASCLIGEISVEPAHLVCRSSDRALEQVESSKSNLQGNRPPKAKNRQIRLLQHTQSASPLKGFRILQRLTSPEAFAESQRRRLRAPRGASRSR